MSSVSLPARIETVIVGAGQAGLSMSALLSQAGREHVVLEQRHRLGGGWLDRWDAFRLVSPNWTASFPGFPYDDADSDGFMPRDAIADRIARYARATQAPVVTDTKVTRLEPADAPPGRFDVVTPGRTIRADRVIVATGGFQVPKIPPVAAQLSSRVLSMHAHAYRNAAALPPGGVLVVGSGQTGVQLAEELEEAGRRVVLATGRCGRAPRRYRGRDIFTWLWSVRSLGEQYGLAFPMVHELRDPRARYACNPHLSGHGGGHTTNLRRFAAERMTLAGRLVGVDGEWARFAGDLRENLRFADRWFDERWRPLFDRYITSAAIDAPEEEPEQVEFEPPELTSLDLRTEGISTVLWTTGYQLDYRWIRLPVLDGEGIPAQVDGVSTVEGLSFIGLPWLRDQGSATLFGIQRDAVRLAERLESSRPH